MATPFSSLQCAANYHKDVIVAMVVAALLPAGPGCTVREERRLATATGVFEVDGSRVAVTVPATVGRFALPEVFLEVTGSPRDLFLDGGGGAVRVAHGAAVKVAHKAGRRIAFRLTRENGERPCEWQPSIAIRRHGGPEVMEGFARIRPGPPRVFRNVGDPVAVGVSAELAKGDREFHIEGIPAMVLARMPNAVILRDPKPSAGMRTIDCGAYAVTLPFLDVRLTAPSAATPWVGIEIRGIDFVRLPARLGLYNYDSDTFQLRCGRRIDVNPYWDELHDMPLTGGRDGILQLRCSVRLGRPGRVALDAMVAELARPRFR